jgi:hypothetical protein
MLEKLSETLKKTTDKIANAIFLDKNLVDQIVKDLQRALIEADVNVSLVLEITKKIKQSALDERISGIEKKEHIIKLLHDELVKILGEKKQLKLQKTQNRIMLLGLYGAGKTTTVRILSTLLRPDSGRATVAGIDVIKNPEKVREVIGLSGQYAAVDEILTGYDNLVMFGELYHLGKNPAALEALTKLQPFAAGQELLRIQAALSTPNPKAMSQAPAPINPVNSGGDGSVKSVLEQVKKDDVSDFIDRENRKELRKRKGA